MRNIAIGYYSYRTPQTHLLSNKSCGFPLLLKFSNFQATFSVTAFLYQGILSLSSFLCHKPLLLFSLSKQHKATCNFIQWDLWHYWTPHCYSVYKKQNMVNKLLTLIHIHDIPGFSLVLESGFHRSNPQLQANAGVILHSQNYITTPWSTNNVCSCLPFVGWRKQERTER